MFLPWTRCVAPLVVTGRYHGLKDNMNGRGLIALLMLEADTPVTLRAGTVLVLPAFAALVEQLPHDRVGEVVTIRYDGEGLRSGPRPDGRPGVVRHVFTVAPGAADATEGPPP
jgi:hypothetical protein